LAGGKLNLGQTRRYGNEQSRIDEEEAFALDWIDKLIGKGEYRRALIIAGRPMLSDDAPHRQDETLERAALDFHVYVRDIAAAVHADFLRFESCGVLIGWLSLNGEAVIAAASAALQLAAWTHDGVRGSCTLSVGHILVSDREKSWSDFDNMLSGGFFAHLGSAQTRDCAGKAIASQAFKTLYASCDVEDTADFHLQSCLNGNAGFFELRSGCPTVAASEHVVSQTNAGKPSFIAQQRELASEKRFFSLGRKRRLLSVAAVIGKTFDCALLGQSLSMEPAHIRGIVKNLQTMLVPESKANLSAPQVFCFADDDIYEIAYRALPLHARALLHERVAQCLVSQQRDGAVDTKLPAAIAWHFAQSGKAPEAGAWSRTAALDAVVNATPDRAIAYLRLAYYSLKNSKQKIPISEWSGLYRLLGTQLAIVHGNASPKVLETYQHGLASANRSVAHVSETEFDTIWGLVGCHLTRGELGKARIASRDLMRIAECQDEDEKKILAFRMVGLTELLLGNLPSAVFNLKMCLEAYDFSRHATLRYQYGSDQLALAHTHLAWAHALTADTASCQKHAGLARRQANILQHAHTNAHVSGVLSLVYEMEGRLREARAMDLACATLARHYRFPYWEAWSGIVRSSLTILNDPHRALADLQTSTVQYRNTGAKQLIPWACARAAKACIMIGDLDEGQDQVRAGLRVLEETGIRVFEPELRFWQAQCLMRQGQSAAADRILQKFSILARRMRVRNVLRDEIYPPGIAV